MLQGEYEVINAGVPGYSSEQGKRFFANDLLQLQPDIVCMMFAWNDHWAAPNYIADKDQQFPPTIVLELQNLLARLHSYRLLKKAVLSQIESHPDSLWDRDSVVYRVSYQDFADNLTELCAVCESHGARPILMTSPAPSLSRYGQKRGWAPAVRYHQIYSNKTRELARTLGVQLVDAAVELDHYDGMYDDVRHDFIHFNAAGHRVIAEMLAAKIREFEAN
jgi:lysophospholipase L1-like esterase